MREWAELTGRHYAPVSGYRTDDAEQIVVAMGTMADTATAVVDQLRAAGRRVGSVTVTAFRPFPAEAVGQVVRNASAIAVIERTDEPAAHDNPLTRELKAALCRPGADGIRVPRVVSASAGLGSRDVAAGDIAAAFDWIADPDAMRRRRHVVLGDPPSARPRAGPDRHPAARRLQRPRPLDRRLRVGDDEQAARDPGRGAVRPPRAGLPALRVGEEGPADHLLPHDRRWADPPARRARPRRLRGAP